MNPKPLAHAVLVTLIYSDLFDQPLRTAELHRFLHGYRIDIGDLKTRLGNGALEGYPVVRMDGYLLLAGREELPARRADAERLAAARLPSAVRYGRRIARLPYVRMVGLTGALAAGNARDEEDYDYIIVTAPGRVWTSRLFVLFLVRLAALRGFALCPNYFLSTDALELDDRSIFTARELAQLVPLAGADVYDRLRRLNAWADALLPNAAGSPAPELMLEDPTGQSTTAERLLNGTAGDRLERWEMDRKVRKLSRGGLSPETAFDAARVQGHFNGYRARTLAEFEKSRKAYRL
ncbi:MAG TPA: hypothetical protein VMN57_12115 [Anaerolineales bacterium]|nr:hypothetical protein [Anaerolineales bacterium]